jgi:predicted nucleic acid-binding protein
VTLLDAYALIAFVADEPAAGHVEELLRAGESRILVANLAESIDITDRVHGLAATETRSAIEPLLGGTLVAVVSGEVHAWHATELRGRHYDRRERPLSLTDCFLLAHAVDENEQIATADPPLAAAARAEGVEVVALPDRHGRIP